MSYNADEVTVADVLSDYAPSSNTDTAVADDPETPNAEKADQEKSDDQQSADQSDSQDQKDQPEAQAQQDDEGQQQQVSQVPEGLDDLQKAYFGDDGSVNSEKFFNDFIERKKFEYQSQMSDAQPQKPAEEPPVDPRQEILKQVQETQQRALYSANLLTQYMQKGYAPEQAMQLVNDAIQRDLFAWQQEQLAAQNKKELEEQTKAYREELAAERAKPKAIANINAVAQAIGGNDTFWSLMNDPKYAGEAVERRFREENSDKLYLKGQDYTQAINDWFYRKAANPAFVQELAEIGEARFIKQMFPHLRDRIAKNAVADKTERAKAQKEPRSIDQGKVAKAVNKDDPWVKSGYGDLLGLGDG